MLILNFEVDKKHVLPGEMITYTATIANQGIDDKNNVIFQAEAPEYANYLPNSLYVDEQYIGVNPASGLIFSTIRAGQTVKIVWSVEVESTLLKTKLNKKRFEIKLLDGGTQSSNTIFTVMYDFEKQIDFIQ